MVEMLVIDVDQMGQRIDNFLITYLKGVPKSRIYRALRHGEVRVNKKRVQPLYRLQAGDALRIPPLARAASQDSVLQPLFPEFTAWIAYENDYLLVVNKPAGLPVHGGTGLQGGLIERLRLSRPTAKFLELVHRIDKETSGCLVIAKKRQALLAWHDWFSERQVHKQYLAVVKGRWQGGARRIEAPLLRSEGRGGERVVSVSAVGKSAATWVQPLRYFKQATLVLAKPVTGRTHQIRVHLAYAGHCIIGDPKYGDQEFNRYIQAKRLFLHAAGIASVTTDSPYSLDICIPPDRHFTRFLQDLT